MKQMFPHGRLSQLAIDLRSHRPSARRWRSVRRGACTSGQPGRPVSAKMSTGRLRSTTFWTREELRQRRVNLDVAVAVDGRGKRGRFRSDRSGGKGATTDTRTLLVPAAFWVAYTLVVHLLSYWEELFNPFNWWWGSQLGDNKDCWGEARLREPEPGFLQ